MNTKLTEALERQIEKKPDRLVSLGATEEQIAFILVGTATLGELAAPVKEWREAIAYLKEKYQQNPNEAYPKKEKQPMETPKTPKKPKPRTEEDPLFLGHLFRLPGEEQLDLIPPTNKRTAPLPWTERKP